MTDAGSSSRFEEVEDAFAIVRVKGAFRECRIFLLSDWLFVRIGALYYGVYADYSTTRTGVSLL